MPFKDPQRAREYQKAYQARWHQDRRIERLNAVARRKAEVYWYIHDLKAHSRCTECGFSHPGALQFHHKNKEDKVFSISEAAKNKFSLDRVKAEIKKCVVLCANCHAIHHWRERHDTQSLAAQFEQAERELAWTSEEQAAYEMVFGTSGDPGEEYCGYQEYYGFDPRNRR
jgi:hypothetical protein